MESVMDGLTRLIYRFILGLFVLVTLVLTASIITRFIQPYLPEGINAQIPWAEEVVKYSILWVTWLGSAVVIGERGHFALNLLTRKYPNLKFLQIVYNASIFIVAGLFVYYGSIVAWNMRIQRTPSLQLPKIYINIIVPIAGMLMILYTIDAMRKRKQRKKETQPI